MLHFSVFTLKKVITNKKHDYTSSNLKRRKCNSEHSENEMSEKAEDCNYQECCQNSSESNFLYYFVVSFANH